MIIKSSLHNVLCIFWALHLLPALTYSHVAVVYAQITLDGSLGPRQALQGPNYRIPKDLGQQRGGNLFHSFDVFNLQQGELATFTGPATVQRILARVTGGQASRLNGTLRSEIAGADLFFLNPQGVLFGPHASLDLQGGGGLYLSTADALRLRDGVVFGVPLTTSSVLSTAPPESFGFLRAQPASLTTRGSQLAVAPGATLELVGGDVRLRDSTLTAPGGQLRLVSVGGAGNILVSAPAPQEAVQVPLGHITLQGTQVTTGENGGGTIELLGATVQMESSGINSNTDGERDGGSIRVTATEMVNIAGFDFNHGIFSAAFAGKGSGGQIQITTPVLAISGATLGVTTFGDGAAGAIVLQVGQLTVTNGAQIDSSTTGGNGAGGTIMVSATGDVILSGRGEFFPSALSSSTTGPGAGGSITLQARNVTVTDGAEINSSTGFEGFEDQTGRGGDVLIMATENLTVQGAGSRLRSDVEGEGRGGNLIMHAGEIQLSDGAVISAASIGAGDAGNLTFTVRGALRSVQSAITTEAAQAGGGNITLSAGLVDMRDSRFTAEARGPAGSNGGNVTMQAERIVLNRSQVVANADRGDGGNITIEASAVFLADAVTCGMGQCLSASSRLGVDGTVEISAPVTNVSGTIAPLVQTFAADLALLQEPCAERQHPAPQSRFLLSGREGVPLTPRDLLPSPIGQGLDTPGQAAGVPSQHVSLQPLVLVTEGAWRCR